MIRKSLALAGVAAAAFAGYGVTSAQAGLNCSGFSHTCGETVTTGGLVATNFNNQNLLIDQANPNLYSGYNLTGLTLNFSGEAAITGVVTNSGSSGNVTGTGGSTTTFTYSTTASVALNTALSSISLLNPLTSGPIIVGPSSSTPFAVPVSGSTSTFVGATSYASFLSTFEGGSTVTVTVSASASGGVIGSGGGNLGGSVNTSAAGDVVVLYTYTPIVTTVPEPMTAALFGSALLGLGFIRRRFG
jgi:hypothetical protein